MAPAGTLRSKPLVSVIVPLTGAGSPAAGGASRPGATSAAGAPPAAPPPIEGAASAARSAPSGKMRERSGVSGFSPGT